MEERKELIEYRTPNSKHYLKKDGTIEVELYDEDIHYLTNNGYQDIDNTLTKTNKKYRNRKNDFKTEFSSKEKDNFVNVEYKNKKLKMTLKDSKKIDKVAHKRGTKKSRKIDTIYYEEILENTDLEYEVHSRKLKESIIFKKRPKKNKFTFYIETDLTLVINEDDTISLKDKEIEIFKINRPYMYDKNKSTNENIKYTSTKVENGYELTLKLDKEWLNSEERAYPVTVDPTITNSNSSSSVIDTYIYNGDTSVSTYNQDILKVGTEEDGTKYRSLLKFELPTIPAGYRITDAKLYLYAYPDPYAPVNPETPLASLHALTQDWTEQDAKWNNMNDKYNTRIEDYLHCSRTDTNPSDWTFSIDAFNITRLVQEWYNGKPNYGIMIKQYNEEYLSDGKIGKYISKDYATDNTALKPKIIITYKNYNGLESYLSYTSQAHHFGSSHISNYTGNLTSTFNVANTIGGPLPANLYLVYNTLDKKENKDYGYGLGIKPNLIQTIENITIEDIEMLKYIDEDGTIHFFYKKEEEETNKYYDEDGLGLTIELIENNYIMKDKTNNQNKFVNHNGLYYLEEIKDTANKTLSIQYNTDNKITKIIDASSKEINITYEGNKITFISPHIETTINLTNNLVTSITSLGNTETILYNENNLIEKIVNPNNLAIKYEYINDISSQVKKVTELSKIGNTGNYLTFEYTINDTKITDNKGHTNTYIFNQYGNVIGITSLDENNDLQNAYGKSYSFGSQETSNVNKLLTDKSLIQYVNNKIEDSSFEKEEDTFSCRGSITKSYTNDSRSGEKALKFTVDNEITTEPKIQNNFLVEGCNSITLSFYAKGNGSVNLMLYNGSLMNKKEQVIHLTEEYKRYSMTYNLEDMSSSILNLVFSDICFTDMIIDDIQLEEGNTANYYNVIDNSNFNNNLKNWNIYGATPNETAEVTEVTESVNALKLHAEPQGSIQVNRQFHISGHAGDTFNLSFWYKCNGIIPTEGSALYPGYWATIFLKYPNSEEYGACVPYKQLNIGNENWQFFSENFTAKKIMNT